MISMRKMFWVAIATVMCFEVARVWFIMPLPYSQRLRSIDIAYALHEWRWAVRAFAGCAIAVGLAAVWKQGVGRRVVATLVLAATGGLMYATNVAMAAEHMFRMPERVVMAGAAQNTVEPDRLVVGVSVNGDVRAYPVQFIGYHHQVRDSVGGQPILVTFCTVCRTGRVFSPVVNGTDEHFRLVGMDQFNAMLEDRTTGSWWRQATGEAVTGERKGSVLREIPSSQVTLAQWLSLHPESKVMQPDSLLKDRYSSSYDYETGRSRSELTGTDTVSWREKAWVVGVSLGAMHKAYDWNALRTERVIHDVLGDTPVLLVLADDDASFFVYQRPNAETQFVVRGDSLVSDRGRYDLRGRGERASLTTIQASQEFWHSWRTFHPNTGTYPPRG